MADFDYIIVGGGSAGCVLANRLSTDPKNRVLLLEAGGKDDYVWIKVPVGYLYCIGNPRTDWCMSTEAEAGLNGRALKYPRGRVLGGCSSINGMIYMRGQAADYDGWRQSGNPGWGWDDVLPYFTRAEDHYDGASPVHGSGGEIRVEKQRLRWTILEAFRDACGQAGIPAIDDFNIGDNEGASFFQVTQRKGWRWSASDAFLKPVRSRANLKVVTGALVDKVIVEQGRAVGVAYSLGGTPQVALSGGEVLLAAGAIGSPAILERSGIGDAAHLSALGITPVLDAPQVGANLQDHLQLRCAWRVSGVSTLNQRAANIFGKALIGLEYVLKRSGPMAMAPSQLGVFTKSDARYATANLEYHVQPLSLEAFGGSLDPFPAFTASVCNLRPESRGTSRISTADPSIAPGIRPNYLSTDEDRRVAAQAIRQARGIVAQPALARFHPEEVRPGACFKTEDDLRRAAGDIGTTIFHPVGTAAMGTVVDERLRVNGIGTLRVVDASVMPTITSGNTNAPTMMIAEKGAEMVLADARG
ncbi:GMC family oxidoreductase [Novosphingobium album (ex Hu et al. 2023)]|uniref:GMC family oxidoreductase N-terminal domain-containing protein n=1 Tax=Novosphingobium album (ex Hu et al. 2023) TaxID=2930093 RepID=A0ABT0B3X1_9SPHN|nr:GMC family oxidoreductase N-terminal domain-containing protein [Novosphingobium album (ex Hu et al. 2023)]MCJ2179738.1 GMC family oxidoreductase N-terminal domain-containing protein [Novosphingobium album (ex Hu et al. 2023)]